MAHLNVRGPRIRSKSSTGSSDPSVDSSSSRIEAGTSESKSSSGSTTSTSSSQASRPPVEGRVFFHLAQVSLALEDGGLHVLGMALMQGSCRQ
jgi:hypothetical protein